MKCMHVLVILVSTQRSLNQPAISTNRPLQLSNSKSLVVTMCDEDTPRPIQIPLYLLPVAMRMEREMRDISAIVHRNDIEPLHISIYILRRVVLQVRVKVRKHIVAVVAAIAQSIPNRTPN